MKTLFFDTETQALPLWREPSEHPGQPHLVRVAAVLIDDETDEALATLDHVVRPDGWTISPDAMAVHGITTEMALMAGVPETVAVLAWAAMADSADRIAAFGMPFDKRIMRIGLLRAGWSKPQVDAWQAGRPELCVMRHVTDIVALGPSPKMAARNNHSNKAPTLAEAFRFFFPAEEFREVAGFHDAMDDVMATIRIYFQSLRQAAP